MYQRIDEYQIYFIAKAHGKSVREVFEFLYGPSGIGKISIHGEKNNDNEK